LWKKKKVLKFEIGGEKKRYSSLKLVGKKKGTQVCFP